MEAQNIRLVEPPEQEFSWTNEILSVEIGEKIKVDKKYAKTVSPIISRDVKMQQPNRIYKRDGRSEPGFLIIERTN